MTTQRDSRFRASRRPFGLRAGFSLIEVMTAVFILGLSIAGSLVSLQMAFGMAETARDQTLASQFLQAEIETLRLKNWAELTALPREAVFEIHGDFGEEVARRYTCIRRIEDLRAGVAVKRVVVQATWKTRNGVDRELVYETRIAQNGINDYYYRTLPPQ
jgi:prepilin-type N-terminal cleavage/methylation domain-containing protein